jgi:outer membrane protein assembly complex protein YaeT
MKVGHLCGLRQFSCEVFLALPPLFGPLVRPLLLGVALACSTGRVLEAQTPPGTEGSSLVVRQLKFEGNRAYPEEVLATVIATTQSSWFASSRLVKWIGLGEKRYLNEIDLRRDVLRLTAYYREGGHLEARVDTTVRRTPKDVFITFRVTEGPPIVVDTLAITGVGALPLRQRTELLQDLPLVVEDRFDRRAMLASADTIVARLLDIGYPSAEVFRSYEVDRARRRARVAFEVEPGPPATVGTARIIGARKVDSGLVRSLLVAQPGQSFARRDLFESQRILYRTELFRFAAVEVDTTRWVPGDTVVPVAVRLNESPFHRARATMGFGTNDCFRGGAAWTARNFGGKGRLLDLSARASKIGVGRPADWGLDQSICGALEDDPIGSSLLNYSLTASLRRPGFLSPFNTSTGVLFAERRSEWKVFLREEYGGSFAVRRETPKRIPIVATYRMAWGQTTAPAITFCAYFNACTTDDVVALRERRRSASFAVAVSIPRANDPLDPTRGSNYSFEGVWSDRLIGSDPLTEFTRLQADLAWYYPITRSVTLAWRVRGGLLFSPRAVFDSGAVSFIPPDQRFYVGGPNDVRGFGRNELGPVVYTAPDSAFTPGGEIDTTKLDLVRAFPSGGNTFAVGNVELRLPSPIFPSRMRLALFLDAGTLLERGVTELAPATIRMTPGAGVRIATPLGPARVDVGYNTDPRADGPLYRVEANGDLTLAQDNFSTPRKSRFTVHIAVGQAF